MTVRPFVSWPDKRLRTAVPEVVEITDEIRFIWSDLVETMDAMPGVGLAAPQIGVMMQLAVVDVSPNRKRRILLANPTILSASEKMNTHDEASPNLPGVSALPANNDPIITASAPADNALAISPEYLIPPSEIIFVLIFFIPFFTSSIALN